MNLNAFQVMSTVSTETTTDSWDFAGNLSDSLDTKSSNTHLSLSQSSLATPSGSFTSLFSQLHILESLSLITMLAVISIFVVAIIGAVIISHRRAQHLEDEKKRDEFNKKRRWVKRQSSRYSIDLDRFVADIVGPDGELQVNQKVQELKIPTKGKPTSNQTLNPLAVSIIDLLARNYHGEHLSEHNHNEPIPGNDTPAFNLPSPDPKLKAVNEDDEDVLFDEQSLKSFSRQGSNASDCTLETLASVSLSIDFDQYLQQANEEQPDEQQPENGTNDATNYQTDHKSFNADTLPVKKDQADASNEQSFSSNLTSISMENIERTCL